MKKLVWLMEEEKEIFMSMLILLLDVLGQLQQPVNVQVLELTHSSLFALTAQDLLKHYALETMLIQLQPTMDVSLTISLAQKSAEEAIL